MGATDRCEVWVVNAEERRTELGIIDVGRGKFRFVGGGWVGGAIVGAREASSQAKGRLDGVAVVGAREASSGAKAT